MIVNGSINLNLGELAEWCENNAHLPDDLAKLFWLITIYFSTMTKKIVVVTMRQVKATDIAIFLLRDVCFYLIKINRRLLTLVDGVELRRLV